MLFLEDRTGDEEAYVIGVKCENNGGPGYPAFLTFVQTYIYDSLGHITGSTQQTNGQAYSFGYGYNLAGALTSETYPSGRTIATQYDAANRANFVQGTLDGQQKPYVTYASYSPHGGLALAIYGNNVVPGTNYNSRLQPAAIFSTIGNSNQQYLNLFTYNWGSTHNNGNLQGLTSQYGSGVSGSPLTTLNTAYTYDQLNRIASVSDPGYSRTFNYDAYGNVWVYPHTGPLDGTTPVSNAYSNNRIGSNYDGAGNQTVVNGNSITYDAENRQVTVVDGVYKTSTSYAYDGDGKRVQKTNPNGTTIFVYDAAGSLAAEYSTAATGTSPCLTCYLSTDHLGSTRLVTNENGGVVSRHDFAPFGDEVTAARGAQWGPAADTIAQKFTGKEHDAESGLDYFGARYYGSALGRFTNPDPIGIIKQKLLDPQQWNAYGYARNNPLRFMDPTGQYVINCASDDRRCNKAANEFEKQRQKDLNSKDKNVRAGAAAFGDRGKDNGVNVGFADLASQGLKGKVDISKSGSGKTDVEVTLDYGLKGKSLQETIGHVGTHVLTDMNFLSSYDKSTGMYNGLLNVTHGETEAWAYQAGAAVTREHGFGPNDTEKIQEFLRTNPTYAPILNLPSFPNSAKFPQTNDPTSLGPFQ